VTETDRIPTRDRQTDSHEGSTHTTDHAFANFAYRGESECPPVTTETSIDVRPCTQVSDIATASGRA
jgi:hypothetical protein